jgi:hypothetical protein
MLTTVINSGAYDQEYYLGGTTFTVYLVSEMFFEEEGPGLVSVFLLTCVPNRDPLYLDFKIAGQLTKVSYLDNGRLRQLLLEYK